VGEFYFVVAGPTGAGKSPLIAHMFANSPGTIVVTIYQYSSPPAIVSQILSSCWVHLDKNEVFGVKILQEPLIKASQNKGAPVTIIIELNVYNPDQSTLGPVYTLQPSLWPTLPLLS
jgi:hypothetical protein